MTIEKLIELGVDKDTAVRVEEYLKSESDELNAVHTAEIEKLKSESDELNAVHTAETERLKKENNELLIGMQIGRAIAEAQVWSEKAVYALMNFENISVTDSGEVCGIKEEIERIKRECAVLFKETAVPRVVRRTGSAPVRENDVMRSVMGI